MLLAVWDIQGMQPSNPKGWCGGWLCRSVYLSSWISPIIRVSGGLVGWVCGVDCCGGLSRLRVNMPLVGSHWPSIMMLVSCMMCTCCLVKVGWYPLSQNWPMDSRELLARPGNICACWAVSGRCGKLRRAVWVDLMVLPLGRCTGRPSLVGILFVHGLLVWRKWLVHPELAYVVLFGGVHK